MNTNVDLDATIMNEFINCEKEDVAQWSAIFAFWRLNYNDSWETVVKHFNQHDFGKGVDINEVKKWYDFFATVNGEKYDYQQSIRPQMKHKYEYLKKVQQFPSRV